MSAIVLPGQPVQQANLGAQLEAGQGVFYRHGNLLSSRIGSISRDGATVSVHGKQSTKKVPDIASLVIGTITRISRLQATMMIQTVDGALCADESDFQGVIRAQDVRQTEKDKVRIWHCFRPGDIVRATVLSLGDARSYYLSTAANHLGVVFATSAETDRQLVPVDWQTMEDPLTGEREPRKVAGPAS